MLTLGLSAALGGVPALTLWSALALLTGAALLSIIKLHVEGFGW